MPSFVHDGAELVQGVIRIYDGSGWSDEGDNLFGYDGGEWQLIQPYGDDALNPPQNVRVTALGAETATLDWDDPSQTVTPTHVQVRIIQETEVWTEYDYPYADGFTWPTLSAETDYQFQVRYIVRSNGIQTLASTPISVFFTTLAPDSPSVPAPNPGGGGPTGSTIHWPTPPGGGASCDWEYIVQAFAEHGTGGAWGDTTVTDVIDGNIGDLDIDFVTEGIECGTVCRLKYREVCSGVPGTWLFDTPFVVACDYTDDCGGVAISADFSIAAYADAILAMPQLCWDEPTGTQVIEDHITGERYAVGPGYYSPGFANSNWVLNASPTAGDAGTALAAGTNTNLDAIGPTTDCSFTVEFLLTHQPSIGPFPSTKLARFGGLVAFNAESRGDGVYVSVTFPKAAGTPFSMNGTEDLALDEWHTATVTIDADGNKILYVNGVPDVTNTDPSNPGFSTFSSSLEVYGNQSARLGPIGAWNRVLTAAEVSGLWTPFTYQALTYTVSQGLGNDQWDITNKDFVMPPFKPGTLQVVALGGGAAGSVPAYGAAITATGDLVPGDRYFYKCGNTSTSGGAGGSPGGGGGTGGFAFSEAGPGAGYTDLRHAADSLAGQILVAGGAGGDPNGAPRGGNGSINSGNSLDAEVFGGFGGQGYGATATAGGAPGGGIATAGTRGNGGSANGTGPSSGGGGGGYYGGGAGHGAGGGGGSSYVDPSLTLVSAVLGGSNIGALTISAEVAVPPAAKLAKDAGAVAVWPMTDPFGFVYKNIVNPTYDAACKQIFGGGIEQGCNVQGPDELRYQCFTNVAGTNENGQGIINHAGIRPPTSGTQPGWVWEGFISRQGAHTGGFKELCGFCVGSATKMVIGTGAGNDTAYASITGASGGFSLNAKNWFNTDGQWRHFLVRVRTNNTVELYIDGVLQGSGTWVGTFTSQFNTNGGYASTPNNHRRASNFGFANHAIYQTDVYTAQHVSDMMGAFGL